MNSVWRIKIKINLDTFDNLLYIVNLNPTVGMGIGVEHSHKNNLLKKISDPGLPVPRGYIVTI